MFPMIFRIVRMEVDYSADVVDCADERLELLLFHEDCVPSFAFDSEDADRDSRGRTEFRDGEVLQALIFERLKRVKNNVRKEFLTFVSNRLAIPLWFNNFFVVNLINRVTRVSGLSLILQRRDQSLRVLHLVF